MHDTKFSYSQLQLQLESAKQELCKLCESTVSKLEDIRQDRHLRHSVCVNAEPAACVPSESPTVSLATPPAAKASQPSAARGLLRWFGFGSSPVTLHQEGQAAAEYIPCKAHRDHKLLDVETKLAEEQIASQKLIATLATKVQQLDKEHQDHTEVLMDAHSRHIAEMERQLLACNDEVPHGQRLQLRTGYAGQVFEAYSMTLVSQQKLEDDVAAELEALKQLQQALNKNAKANNHAQTDCIDEKFKQIAASNVSRLCHAEARWSADGKTWRGSNGTGGGHLSPEDHLAATAQLDETALQVVLRLQGGGPFRVSVLYACAHPADVFACAYAYVHVYARAHVRVCVGRRGRRAAVK